MPLVVSMGSISLTCSQFHQHFELFCQFSRAEKADAYAKPQVYNFREVKDAQKMLVKLTPVARPDQKLSVAYQ